MRLEFCKRGHPRERRNKHGACMDCANLIRRKGKTYRTHCQRGHKWIPGQRRCLECRAEWSRAHSKRQMLELHDVYVKNSIKWKDAPPEIVEVARLKILLKRGVRSWNSEQ